MVTNYILLCLRSHYEDKIFDTPLIIDEELRTLYSQQLSKLEERTGQAIPVAGTGSAEYTDAYYLNNARTFASMAEDKFGISLT